MENLGNRRYPQIIERLMETLETRTKPQRLEVTFGDSRDSQRPTESKETHGESVWVSTSL